MASPFFPTLSAHGAEVPAIGFGTSSLGDCGEVVATALKLGYRHIDTAWKYGTERGVGEGMRASGVPRSDIFLTTKVSHEYLRTDDFARSVEQSLRNLGVDFVDLLLVHWPNPDIPLSEPIAALAKSKRQGLTRHIGVANFNIAMLDEAIRLCPEPLINLQAEYHAHLDQTKLIEACRKRGLVFTAYCPLGRGRLLRDPVLADIAARKDGRSPKSRCAGSFSRAISFPSRARRTPHAWPRTSRCSTSRSPRKRCSGLRRSSGPMVGSPIPRAARRRGIEIGSATRREGWDRQWVAMTIAPPSAVRLTSSPQARASSPA
jgi:2,5-diketo-D-gluconate reductase B